MTRLLMIVVSLLIAAPSFAQTVTQSYDVTALGPLIVGGLKPIDADGDPATIEYVSVENHGNDYTVFTVRDGKACIGQKFQPVMMDNAFQMTLISIEREGARDVIMLRQFFMLPRTDIQLKIIQFDIPTCH